MINWIEGSIKAPTEDMGVILVIFKDYPFPTIAVFNQHEEKWVYPTLQSNMVGGEYSDDYWESEYANTENIIKWAKYT